MIYYAEGDIKLNGRPLLNFNPMVRVATGETLRVDVGRSEILLQPQNFLRLSEHSSVEVRSDLLSSVELLLEGVAIVDVSVVDTKNSISAHCGDVVAELLRQGIYRFDCRRGVIPDSLRVERGRARVTKNGRNIEITDNKMILLDSRMDIRKVKVQDFDAFDRWSALRKELINRMRGQETLFLDKNKSLPAGVIIVPGESRGVIPN